MSTDGGANFTTLLASYAVLQSGGGGSPGTWSSTVYNPIYSLNQAAAAADNQADVIFRFRSLVAGAATGSNRIDNVMIYSGPIPAPGAIALLGVAGLAGLRRRR
jgi:MYXO-CTERM domain-containing protein